MALLSKSSVKSLVFSKDDFDGDDERWTLFLGDRGYDTRGFLFWKSGDFETLLLASVFLDEKDWVSWNNKIGLYVWAAAWGLKTAWTWFNLLWMSLNLGWLLLLLVLLGCWLGSGGRLNLVRPIPLLRNGFLSTFKSKFWITWFYNLILLGLISCQYLCQSPSFDLQVAHWKTSLQLQAVVPQDSRSLCPCLNNCDYCDTPFDHWMPFWRIYCTFVG